MLSVFSMKHERATESKRHCESNSLVLRSRAQQFRREGERKVTEEMEGSFQVPAKTRGHDSAEVTVCM